MRYSGVADNLSLRHRDPRDSFEDWLTDLLAKAIGKPAMAHLSVTFETVDDHDICRIDVDPSRTPVYAKYNQAKDFYVRSSVVRDTDTCKEGPMDELYRRLEDAGVSGCLLCGQDS